MYVQFNSRITVTFDNVQGSLRIWLAQDDNEQKPQKEILVSIYKKGVGYLVLEDFLRECKLNFTVL